jgi:MFS family permease
MSAGPSIRGRTHTLVLLGLPTFGLALAITIVSSYLPTVARQFTSSTTAIGVLVGGEGLFALFLPLLVGSWSDRLHTRIGGRLPFVLAGAPVAALGLVGMAVAGSLGAAALAVAVFFVGYFVAYEPYRALYPDLVDDEAEGRAQSSQAVARGLGTIVALLAGGILLAIGQAVPFLLGAALVLLSCGSFAGLVLRRGAPDQERTDRSTADSVRLVWGLLRDERPLRDFFVANGLWELSLAALKTFVILWLTRGMGVSLSEAAVAVAVVAIFVLAGAAVSGVLADKRGRRPVMLAAVAVFGTVLLVPFLVTAKLPIAVVAPVIAFGGGVLMSQPYALLVPLMPEEHHGALTGFYTASRGIGIMLGPLIGGAAVAAASGVMASTEGYAAVWLVCALASLLSIPFLRRVPDPEAESEQQA